MDKVGNKASRNFLKSDWFVGLLVSMAVIDKAMVKDSDQRYQRGDSMAADLRNCLANFEAAT